jgi:Domain of unknown function (DUF5916)/Carbohydrate family 9 binding domain-like
MKKILLFFLTSLYSVTNFAQNDKFAPQPFDVKATTEKIKIDGILDEKVWQNTPTTGDFWQYFPTDTLKAKQQTEVKITFDEKYLYVSAKCYSKNKDYVITSNRRDFRAGGNDNISFIFDTFNDKTNAFLFGMNPNGVMREALISNGGSDNNFFSLFWDNKWQGESKIYDGYWICEMAIPFSTLRFSEGSQRWNFLSYRFDTQTNETSSLVRIPQVQIIFNLAFTAPMLFEKPLKKSGANISLIPYVAASSLNDFEKNNPSSGSKITAGGDAKVGITSGLNLDLTVNPDFSNVEADRQVTNLTRFDISYPEQRQFFLENSDLFTNFGSESANPFFSRRIGIAQDSASGISVQNRINFGARISGKLNDNWRVGVMGVQTGEDKFKGISATNYIVGAIQRKVFSRSNISFLYVDKNVLNPEIGGGVNSFNRVAGLEYNLASSDNRWAGKFYHHLSYSPVGQSDNFSNGSNLAYFSRKFRFDWLHEWVGKGYNAEVGFVPRNDFFHFNVLPRINFYPNGKVLNRYDIGAAYDQVSVAGYGITDRQISIGSAMNFQNTARLFVLFFNNFTSLYNYKFNPLRNNNTDSDLPVGSKFTYNNVRMEYLTDQRPKIAGSLTTNFGEYYNGNIVSVSGSTSYRYQPYGAFTLNFTYNHITSPTVKNDIFLIGPRVDLTFTKSVFWTTFVQYNSQFDNMNINSRLQWRFAPVSDFFLVYTDNYNTFNGLAKNRALFAKITYWFNV